MESAIAAALRQNRIDQALEISQAAKGENIVVGKPTTLMMVERLLPISEREAFNIFCTVLEDLGSEEIDLFRGRFSPKGREILDEILAVTV